jgi:phage shock protein PspC (stress-responsive transcriptional regulator)
MPPPMQPEFFLLLGVDLFLATSLLTCLLDRHFPWQLPYLYQLAALIGFGQLFVSREFLSTFDDYMRFWYSTLYLIVALASMVGINAYLGIVKKLLNYAKVVLFTVTFPALTISAFFITSYAQVAIHPLAIVPQVSWEATFIGMVAFDTFVVGIGTYVFFKPKWWYIAIGAGTAIIGASVYASLKPTWGQATFVVSAIGLALACVLVLGISVYVLAKIWIDTLKQRKRKKEVK